jgi:hypothetical protein
LFLRRQHPQQARTSSTFRCEAIGNIVAVTCGWDEIAHFAAVIGSTCAAIVAIGMRVQAIACIMAGGSRQQLLHWALSSAVRSRPIG